MYITLCFTFTVAFPSLILSSLFFKELKIEGEQTEVLEDDTMDFPTKKKKSKKVDFDEGELLEKDDGKNKSPYL